MSKLTNPFFYVAQIDIYLQNIIFSVNQSDEEFLKSIVNAKCLWPKGIKRNKKAVEAMLDSFANMEETTLARTVIYDTGVIVIRFQNIDSFYHPDNLGLLSHEIFHAVVGISNKKGFTLSDSSEENFAYLIGYVTTLFFAAYQKANSI